MGAGASSGPGALATLYQQVANAHGDQAKDEAMLRVLACLASSDAIVLLQQQIRTSPKSLELVLETAANSQSGEVHRKLLQRLTGLMVGLRQDLAMELLTHLSSVGLAHWVKAYLEWLYTNRPRDGNLRRQSAVGLESVPDRRPSISVSASSERRSFDRRSVIEIGGERRDSAYLRRVSVSKSDASSPGIPRRDSSQPQFEVTSPPRHESTRSSLRKDSTLGEMRMLASMPSQAPHYRDALRGIHLWLACPAVCKTLAHARVELPLTQILVTFQALDPEALLILEMLQAISDGGTTILPFTSPMWRILAALLQSDAPEHVITSATYVATALQDARGAAEAKRLMLTNGYHEPLATALGNCAMWLRVGLSVVPAAPIIFSLQMMLPEALTRSLSFTTKACSAVWAALLDVCDVPSDRAGRGLASTELAPLKWQVVDSSLAFTEVAANACSAPETFVAAGCLTAMCALCRALPSWIPPPSDRASGRLKRCIEQLLVLAYERTSVKVALLMEAQFVALVEDAGRWIHTTPAVVTAVLRMVNYCVEEDMARGHETDWTYLINAERLFRCLCTMLLTAAHQLQAGQPKANNIAALLLPTIDCLLGRTVRAVPPSVQRLSLPRTFLARLVQALTDPKLRREAEALYWRVWKRTIEEESERLQHGVELLQRVWRAYTAWRDAPEEEENLNASLRRVVRFDVQGPSPALQKCGQDEKEARRAVRVVEERERGELLTYAKHNQRSAARKEAERLQWASQFEAGAQRAVPSLLAGHRAAAQIIEAEEDAIRRAMELMCRKTAIEARGREQRRLYETAIEARASLEDTEEYLRSLVEDLQAAERAVVAQAWTAQPGDGPAAVPSPVAGGTPGLLGLEQEEEQERLAPQLEERAAWLLLLRRHTAGGRQLVEAREARVRQRVEEEELREWRPLGELGGIGGREATLRGTIVSGEHGRWEELMSAFADGRPRLRPARPAATAPSDDQSPTASDVLALVGKLSLQVDQLVTAQTTRDTETRRRLDRLQDVVEALRDSVVQTDGVAELREAYVQLAERESEVVALATHLRDRSARRIQDAFRTSTLPPSEGRRAFLLKRAAAGVLQRVWRGYATRQWMVGRHSSALVLQCLVRCRAARKELQARRSAAGKVHTAARSIQARYRGRLARLHVLPAARQAREEMYVRRDMMEKELEDRWEVLAEEQAARWELLRVRTAAFCAVCEEREPFDRMPIAKEEVAARREIEAWLYSHCTGTTRNTAALCIQRCWRRHCALKEVELHRRSRWARSIQTAWRGYWARRELQALKRRWAAAVAIQRVWRGSARRRKFTAWYAAAVAGRAQLAGDSATAAADIGEAEHQEVCALHREFFAEGLGVLWGLQEQWRAYYREWEEFEGAPLTLGQAEVAARLAVLQGEAEGRHAVVTSRPSILLDIFSGVLCERCADTAALFYCGVCAAYLCRGCSNALHLAARSATWKFKRHPLVGFDTEEGNLKLDTAAAQFQTEADVQHRAAEMVAEGRPPEERTYAEIEHREAEDRARLAAVAAEFHAALGPRHRVGLHYARERQAVREAEAKGRAVVAREEADAVGALVWQQQNGRVQAWLAEKEAWERASLVALRQAEVEAWAAGREQMVLSGMEDSARDQLIAAERHQRHELTLFCRRDRRVVVTTERLQTEERRARVFVEQEWAGVLAGLRAGVRVLAGRSAQEQLEVEEKRARAAVAEEAAAQVAALRIHHGAARLSALQTTEAVLRRSLESAVQREMLEVVEAAREERWQLIWAQLTALAKEQLAGRRAVEREELLHREDLAADRAREGDVLEQCRGLAQCQQAEAANRQVFLAMERAAFGALHVAGQFALLPGQVIAAHLTVLRGQAVEWAALMERERKARHVVHLLDRRKYGRPLPPQFQSDGYDAPPALRPIPVEHIPAPSTLWYRAPAPPALPAPPAPIDVVEAEEEFEAGPPGDRVMGLAVDAPLLVMERSQRQDVLVEERGRRLALVCRKLDATLSEPEQRARQTLGRVEAFSRLELEVPASQCLRHAVVIEETFAVYSGLAALPCEELSERRRWEREEEAGRWLLWRGKVHLVAHRERTAAAIRIQRAWRGHAARTALRRRRTAAVRLQRLFRGCAARATQAAHVAAAVRLQFAVRRHLRRQPALTASVVARRSPFFVRRHPLSPSARGQAGSPMSERSIPDCTLCSLSRSYPLPASGAAAAGGSSPVIHADGSRGFPAQAQPTFCGNHYYHRKGVRTPSKQLAPLPRTPPSPENSLALQSSSEPWVDLINRPLPRRSLESLPRPPY